jgi:hypothetical protein
MRYHVVFKHHETKKWLGEMDGEILPVIGDMVTNDKMGDSCLEVLYRIFQIPEQKKRVYSVDVEMLCQVVKCV